METKPNIYLFNLLKSPNVKFDKNESFIISRILSLGTLNSSKELALVDVCAKLLKICKMGNVETWSQIDRVCLVARDSYSN